MDIIDFYLEDLKSKFNKINPIEYYLSYSGGKDSHLLYWFIKEYANIDEIIIVGINTCMEHQEIRERIYANSDKVLLPNSHNLHHLLTLFHIPQLFPLKLFQEFVKYMG